MADANQMGEELMEILGRAGEQQRLLGSISEDTAKEMALGKQKFAAYTDSVNHAYKALVSLTKAAGSAAGAMYRGEKGAAALNEAFEGVGDAISNTLTAISIALAPFTMGLSLAVGGLALATKGLTKWGKESAKMADDLYKGYSSLTKSGGAASDGMKGLFEDTKRLGLSMKEMDTYISTVAANSQQLARYSGTVSDGRKAMAGVGEALKKNREEFQSLGITMPDVVDGLGGFMKMQAAMGRTQSGSVQEMASAAREYILEQDKLTRLTGMSRQQLEEKAAAALTEEQYGAKMLELQMRADQGDKAAKAEMERIDKLNKMAESAGPEFAKGMRGAIVGNLRDPATRKLMLTAQGNVFETAEQVVKGMITPAKGMDKTLRDVNRFTQDAGTAIGQVGALHRNYLPVAELNNAYALSREGFEKRSLKVDKDTEKIRKGLGDSYVKNQAQLINTEIDANESMERLVESGIYPTQKAMLGLASATDAAAAAMNKTFGGLARGAVRTIGTEPGGAPAAPAAAPAAPALAAAESKETADQKQAYADRQALLERKKQERDQRQVTAKAAAKAKESSQALVSAAPAVPAPGAPGQTVKGTISRPEAAPAAEPAAAAPATIPKVSGPVKDPTDKLLAHIGQKESNGNYNALVGGRTLPELTSMTISQVLELQDKMKNGGLGQKFESTAVGKYQIIKNTLLGLVKKGKAQLSDIFNASTQDILGRGLLKNRGLDQYLSQKIDRDTFMDRLSMEWASLPYRTGNSYYAGVGSNRSLMSREQFTELFAKDGAVLSGPDSGYQPNLTLHGTEAIIPIKDQNVPVQITMDSTLGQSLVSLDATMRSILDAHKESINLLQEIKRSNDTTAGASVKIARTAAS